MRFYFIDMCPDARKIELHTSLIRASVISGIGRSFLCFVLDFLDPDV